MSGSNVFRLRGDQHQNRRIVSEGRAARPTEIAVFGSSSISPDSAEWRDAYRCGWLLAQGGFTVVTGGYGGAMQAASHGAVDGGGHVVGVTAPDVFPRRTGANPFVAEEDVASSLTERIHRLLERSAGAIGLAGSLGTFTELVMAWNAAYVAAFSAAAPKPLVAVGSTWRALVTTIADTVDADAGLIRCVDTVDEAVAAIATEFR